MKKYLALALLFCQCSTPSVTNEIEPTSVDVEDFGEQIIELTELPFSVVVPNDWELKSSSFEHQLWKSNELKMTFSFRDEELSIAEGSTVIAAENSDITSFCLASTCVVQVQEEGLFEVVALSEEAKEALTRLR